MYEVISNSLKELEQGKNIVLATVVNTKGSTPQKIGSKLLIRDDGSTVGTLGGGCVEGDIWFDTGGGNRSGKKTPAASWFGHRSLAPTLRLSAR